MLGLFITNSFIVLYVCSLVVSSLLIVMSVYMSVSLFESLLTVNSLFIIKTLIGIPQPDGCCANIILRQTFSFILTLLIVLSNRFFGIDAYLFRYSFVENISLCVFASVMMKLIFNSKGYNCCFKYSFPLSLSVNPCRWQGYFFFKINRVFLHGLYSTCVETM